MRNIVMTTAMAFIGGLFTAGLVLAAAETPSGISTQMEEGQQQQVAALKLDEKKVSELQTALKEKGFAVGAVDGIVGPKTMGAIRNFQSQAGLTATGQPDQQTLKALGIEVGEQEFMGVSPEFGEEKKQYQPEQMPMEPMEPMEPMPMPEKEPQPQGPGDRDYR
jgi:hypothetical protein